MTNKSKLHGLGIALGAGLGAVFGVLAGHIGIWLALGVAIGVLLGASFRPKQTDCPQCAQLHRRARTEEAGVTTTASLSRSGTKRN